MQLSQILGCGVLCFSSAVKENIEQQETKHNWHANKQITKQLIKLNIKYTLISRTTLSCSCCF